MRLVYSETVCDPVFLSYAGLLQSASSTSMQVKQQDYVN